MSRLYSMLIEPRTNGNGHAPASSFAEFTGYEGDVPYIEVGGSDPVECSMTPPTPEPEADHHVGLFSVEFRPFTRAVHAVRPAGGVSRELIALHDPAHPISEQYAMLAEEMEAQLDGVEPAVIAMCGPVSSSGTTTVLLNLALTMANTLNKRVAVIEANTVRPAFAARLNVPAEPGLGDLLAGRSAFADVSYRVDGSRLTAVPLGRPLDGLLNLGEFLPTLRHRYDRIFVDTTATGMLDLAGTADGNYLVARSEVADDPRLRELRARMGSAGVRLRGMVLTHSG